MPHVNYFHTTTPCLQSTIIIVVIIRRALPTRCTAPPRRRRRTRLIIEPPESGVCTNGYSIPSIRRWRRRWRTLKKFTLSWTRCTGCVRLQLQLIITRTATTTTTTYKSAWRRRKGGERGKLRRYINGSRRRPETYVLQLSWSYDMILSQCILAATPLAVVGRHSSGTERNVKRTMNTKTSY